MSFLSLTYEVLHISTNFHLPHSLNLGDGGGGGGGSHFRLVTETTLAI